MSHLVIVAGRWPNTRAENGTLGYYPVTRTNVHTDTTILTMTVADDQIETTPNHRFFTSLGWREAGALQSGDRLLTASGYARPIQAITARHEARAMFNLEVETAHTYFVGEG
jgi:intein/homing endonuclease